MAQSSSPYFAADWHEDSSSVRSFQLGRRYRQVRAATESLCRSLLTEDYGVQSMPDVSPPKWHLAHTTWFFENFLLAPHRSNYRSFQPTYHFLFNSYYKSSGPHFEREKRGFLSRPSVQEIYRYRHAIDEQVQALLAEDQGATIDLIEPLIQLGLQHEQQHQELLLMDIKHIFWTNPLRPVFRSAPPRLRTLEPHPTRVLSFPESLAQIGAPSEAPFAFDNEKPRHRVFLEAYGLNSQPVTCGEYLEFIEAGGYDHPSYWLSAGWDTVQKQNWKAPLYWEHSEHRWQIFTLSGMKPLDEHEPVCHLSFFEADAFARWRGLRLPTEAEWENAASAELPASAHFVENGYFHPMAAEPGFFGNVWEWTASPYVAYRGFKPLPSALGEYNGKFMCNQYVLRGGSCATPRSHIRPSYRNFFPPEARWQFSGLRLAT